MKTRPLWSQPRRLGALTLVSITLLQATTPVFATTSQLPGLFVTPPDVNVMFTLDDSGSMQSDALPDYPVSASGVPNDSASGFFASFGLGSKYPNMWGKPGGTDSGYLKADLYRSTNSVAVYMRSSSSNPLYYDPDVTYLPWPDTANDKTRNANASPTAVNVHTDSPFIAGRTLNLDVRWNTSGGSGAADNETKNFWPATWYVWKYKNDPTRQLALGVPTTSLTLADFTKYEIKSTSTSATYPRSATRSDCTGTVGSTGCSYTQERQNFANWLQYYRNRRLMAKGGVAEAFSRQSTNLRVGFASINTTTNGTVVRQGVKPFAGAARKAFYDDLYPLGGTGITPLRLAMDQVGKYFQKTGAGNPWAEDPTASGVGTEWTCRKSFHILSTDGFWNDAAASAPAKNDNDSLSGQTPKKPGAATGYDYSNTGSSSIDPLVGKFRIDPFADGATGVPNTLADVAAYYWKTDLRTDLANEVFTSSRDPAFWQHLTTFTVGLGINGSGTVRRRSDDTVAVPASEPSTSPFYPYIGKKWLENPTMRDLVVTNKVALKWWPNGTSTTNGPAGDDVYAGDDLVHAAINGHGRYFGANSPTALANGLASALAEATNKSSSLSNLVTQTAYLQEGSFVYQATYNPDGWAGRLYAFRQNAKGGVITTPGTEVWEASQQMPDPDQRFVFTWNDTATKGALFAWSDLTTAQQGFLGSDPTIVDYLRGSSAKELQNGGTFRDRPRYTTDTLTKAGVLGDVVDGSPIKGPDAGGGWNRLPLMSPGQADYTTYRSKDTTTLDNLRNSLFLTANDGMLHAFDATTGVERFAYVPASVYSVARSMGGATEQKLKMLADPGYTHRFLVDGPPQIADAFVGPSASAASWKTLLLGSTGAGSRSVFAMDVSDTDAKGGKFDKTKLMWEFPTASTPDMGYVLSYPHVARMRDRSWVAIFGNGYDSETGQAKLYIVNLQTGTVLKEIAAGTAGGNGLSQPNFTVNNNREVTAIYAGDLKGNVWRFDVDSEDPASWGVAFGGTPLFTAGNKQPITVMPELTFHPSGGVVVTFGTGKMFETEDTSTSTSLNVNLNTQSIYGIWDKPGETTGLADTSLLVEHKDDTTLAAAGDTSLKGTKGDTIDATKRGWFINLVYGPGERVTVNPQQAGTVLFVVANTPKVDPCSGGGSSRIFALDPITGNPPTFGVFDADNSGTITAADKGYNVWNISGGVLSLPLLQRKTASGGVVTESKYSRGQTGARLGGVEPKPGSPTDCDANLLVGVSDTSGKNRDVSLCKKGNDRVSWRQLR